MAGISVGPIGLTNVGRFSKSQGLLPDAPGDDAAVPIIEVFGEDDDQFDPGYADPAPIESAATAITGTASITEANDTLVSAALNVLPEVATPIMELFGEDDQFDAGYADPAPLEVASTGISGTASITEADDTLSSTAVLVIKATAAITEADDTLSATATLKIQATAAITEADDTVTSAATLKIQATAAITEADDAMSAADTLKIQAQAAMNAAADTLSATATLLIQATASITQADDTLSATGGEQQFEAPAPIVTLFEEEDEPNRNYADPAPLEAAGGGASTADIYLYRVPFFADPNDIRLLDVTVAVPDATAVLAVTEANDTLAATATIPSAGSSDIYLYRVPFFADPNDIRLLDVTIAAGDISAILSVTEGDDAASATDALIIHAQAAMNAAADTMAATAVLTIQGTVSSTEQDDVLVSTAGTVSANIAILGVTEANDTLSSDAHNDTLQQVGGAGSGPDGIRRRGVGRGRSLKDILDEIKTRHATAAIVEAGDTLVATAQIVTLPIGLSAENRHEQIAALIERTEALLEEEEAAILLLLAA